MLSIALYPCGGKKGKTFLIVHVHVVLCSKIRFGIPLAITVKFNSETSSYAMDCILSRPYQISLLCSHPL